MRGQLSGLTCRRRRAAGRGAEVQRCSRPGDECSTRVPASLNALLSLSYHHHSQSHPLRELSAESHLPPDLQRLRFGHHQLHSSLSSITAAGDDVIRFSSTCQLHFGLEPLHCRASLITSTFFATQVHFCERSAHRVTSPALHESRPSKHTLNHCNVRMDFNLCHHFVL